MAQMRISGIVAGYDVREKKNFETKALEYDKDGKQIFNRKMQVLDMDETTPNLFKINVPEELDGEAVKFLKQNAIVKCSVGQFNGHTFFRLTGIEAAK